MIDLSRGVTDVTALLDALFHGPEAPNFVDNLVDGSADVATAEFNQNIQKHIEI